MNFLYKLLKNLFSVLLIPFCLGSFLAIWQIILLSEKATFVWSIFLGGVISWIVIYLLLPEPKWLYVFGHESTHAIWSIIFGGKLKRFRVRSTGGHVSITKSNFLITLAPYFFPFYSVLVFFIYYLINIFKDISPFVSYFYFLIGLTYAFHITLTYKILKIKQPDIIHEGYVFSSIIIILGNMLILLMGIPLLSNKINISASFDLWIHYSFQIYQYIFNLT